MPGLHLIGALHVVVRAAIDRAQERNLVDVPAEMREDLRDVDAALSVLLEREWARHQRPGEALAHDHVAAYFAVDRLTRILLQRGLGIERVHLAPAAAHEQRDDRRGAGAVVRRLWREGIHAGGRARTGIRLRGRQDVVATQQVGERESTDAATRLKQELAAIPEVLTAAVRHRLTSGR